MHWLNNTVLTELESVCEVKIHPEKHCLMFFVHNSSNKSHC